MSQLADELVLCVQPRDDVREEQMTSTDEIKAALSKRMDAVLLLPVNGHLTSLLSDALDRFGNQTYGLCATCERRISPKRLAALPWARYCITCQEMREDFAAEVP
jgi:DnaK suppressor protein